MPRQPEVTVEDVMAVFEDRDDQCEPLTAGEIADALDCSDTTAWDTMKDAVRMGEAATKKVGPSRVYWVPCEE